ncbi:MAG TPA: 50S ribosomal protein L6 [Candidatus Brocadiia bacterium]|nr:50S ribosomal protein L6 [Planctomycetota bacterium]MDO8092450.1 50S ribosomal protein L6 [Candidatus Brocadiales bacterium]
MSRIGKKPIPVPDNVKVNINDRRLSAEGPKGKLTQEFHQKMTVEYDEKSRLIHVKRPSDDKQQKALQGLTRSLIANLISGVTNGFSKTLEINGVGYSVKVQGREVVLQLGFSHPVNLKIPDGLEVEEVSKTNPGKLTIRGAGKQLVGQFAAFIRDIRPAEPYKGKGIKYAGEVIRRKAGKAFAAAQ